MQPVPLSDTSIILYFGENIDRLTNRRVHLMAASLAIDPLPGVIEAVPGYASLVIHYDPLILTYSQLCNWLLGRAERITETATRPRKTIHVPVIYNGPDLAWVAEANGLTRAEIIRLHTSTAYMVYMMGFTPGFPYLGILPEALRVARRSSPRTHVPAGAVAIAGMQTGIYPQPGPGGWQIIGQTALKLFDPQREPPFLFSPGDRVTFFAQEE